MSNYNAMELKARKRFASGLSFEAHYTWAKNLGYNSPAYQGFGGTDNLMQDHYNLRSEKSVLATDVPHAFVAHYSYPLPFGAVRQGALPAWRLGSGWNSPPSVWLPNSGVHDNLRPIFIGRCVWI